MPKLPLILLALALTGCAASTATDRPLPPPASLVSSCAAPVRIPDRALSDQEVEVLWGRDRKALRDCASRHGGLSEWAAAVTAAPQRKGK